MSRPIKDLTGMRFGRLTVIERGEKDKRHGNTRWVVECDCTTRKLVYGNNLIATPGTKSCGCLRKERFIKHPQDLTGMRFGALVVKSRGRKDQQGRWYWEVQCDVCGGTHVVRSDNFRHGLLSHRPSKGLPPPHGTSARYFSKNHACRCSACRDAGRIYRVGIKKKTKGSNDDDNRLEDLRQ
jgi:hypothetical protein